MIFEVFGVRVRLHFGFVAVVTLTMLLAKTEIVLMSLGSAILHEFGHIALLCAFGDKPESIEFGAFGMRLTRRGASWLSSARELAVLLAGAGVNLILAAATFTVYTADGSRYAKSLCVVNIAQALFNLLPFEALDGGRALRLLLEKRLTDSGLLKAMTIISLSTSAIIQLAGVFIFSGDGFSLSLVCVNAYLIVLTVSSVLKSRTTEN